MDKIIKSMAYDKSIRIYVINSTNILETAREKHELYPTSAAALGRTMSANLLMASLLSKDQTVEINIDGQGLGGKIATMASGNGYVNGYIENPKVYVTREDGHLDVAKAVGKDGFLKITKDIGLKEKYTSSVPIISGELGEDFTYYFASSEQIPSSVAVSVLVHQDGHIISSAGFIIQVLPFCKDEVIDKVEQLITTMKPISEVLQEGGTIEEILSYLADGTEEITEIQPIEFYCPCNKEHYLNRLSALSNEDLLDLANDEVTTVICPRCSTKYEYTSEDLKKIVEGR